MVPAFVPQLGDEEFDGLRRLIHAKAGITLGENKRALLASRLAKRLRAHGYATFRDYYELVTKGDPTGRELLELINCITTNKTSFFREPHHFDMLRKRLPEFLAAARARGTHRLRIWSAGCSTGEEPYSIAAVLDEELRGQGWDVKVLASDIDTAVLAQAEAGIYPARVADEIPPELRRRMFQDRGDHVRVTEALREMVSFRRVNLIEEAWPIRTRFDAIFCRNVTIYFDHATQQRLYARFAAQLEPHGYFFAGHSENLHWVRAFSLVGETVYRHATPGVRRRSSLPPRRRSLPPRLADAAIVSGQLFASAHPTLVRTVLGSCVAACVFDPEARVGGMNHFMLAQLDGADRPGAFGGEGAMTELLSRVLEHGGRRERLRAKLFGGASVLDLGDGVIPADNVRFARTFLERERIPVVAERVGGELPMQVHFETHTGRALVRVVEKTTITELEPARAAGGRP